MFRNTSPDSTGSTSKKTTSKGDVSKGQKKASVASSVTKSKDSKLIQLKLTVPQKRTNAESEVEASDTSAISVASKSSKTTTKGGRPMDELARSLVAWRNPSDRSKGYFCIGKLSCGSTGVPHSMQLSGLQVQTGMGRVSIPCSKGQGTCTRMPRVSRFDQTPGEKFCLLFRVDLLTSI